jgi:PAS domain S-box-containing protein
VGISIFAYDVTSRVESRREMEAQRIQLQSLFEQAPVAISVLRGNDYRLEVVNPLMGLMLGRPLSELVGKPFFEAMPELIGQGLQQLLNEVQQTGVPFLAQEQAVHMEWHQPGEFGFYNFLYQPLRDHNGLTTGITYVAIDVSEQVAARQQIEQSEKQAQTLAKELAAINEELRAANEEIRSTNEELGEANVRLLGINGDLDNFIYMASHDLKAPISNIEGFIGMLFKSLPPSILADERIGQLTQLIQISVNRFKQTISSLTDVVKLQKESNQVIETVDLAQVVREVRLDLAPQMEAAQAVLDATLNGCPTILFSEKNLRSVVYNLLSNAIKYSSSDRTPVVQLACHQEEFYSVLSVSDNGIGMDLSRKTKLFTMFGRLHDHVEGSGVGLYMVKKMVENAGGKIEVASQVGVGTTFRIYFPLGPVSAHSVL